jgi:hypothetical protein
MLDTTFFVTTITTMAGWLALLLSPLNPTWSERIAGAVLPLLLSVAYAVLLVMLWSDEGGYGDLACVSAMFAQPEGVLVAWVHFLAFDLFVGAWICRQARQDGITFWLVIPCLVLAFLFGPVGYLMFSIVRALTKRRPSTA